MLTQKVWHISYLIRLSRRSKKRLVHLLFRRVALIEKLLVFRKTADERDDVWDIRGCGQPQETSSNSDARAAFSHIKTMRYRSRATA